MKVVSLDVGFNHSGFCLASYDLEANRIEKILGLHLISTEPIKTKTVRRSSDDYRRACEIARWIRHYTKDVAVAFCEIPSGTQSARASWALGIALGTLTNITCPVIQVTPTQTKLAGPGKKDATKEQMIAWATEKYPDLQWIRHRGKLSPKNEHLADAVAILHAGVELQEFQDLIRLASKVSQS